MKKTTKYTRHIIAYMDILGFKEIVEGDSHNQLFADLFSLINGFANQNMADMRLKGTKAAVLSDSLIFSISYKERGSFDKILRILYPVQKILMEHKVLLRGAISVGDLYHENNVVFGPALVKAYLLQEHSAIYPRCIIQQDVLKECLQTCSSDISRSTTLDQFVLDTDGFWFHDYFTHDLETVMYSDGKHGTDKTTHYINLYRSMIEENLDGRHSPRVHAKYQWLKSSFNSALEGLSERENYDVDLRQFQISPAPVLD